MKILHKKVLEDSRPKMPIHRYWNQMNFLDKGKKDNLLVASLLDIALIK